MKNIEAAISPLIQSQFPQFYRDEGPEFIAFCQAYYEWLEQNHQMIVLEDVSGFNIGDIVSQANVTGRIVSYVDESSILVLVDGLETFKSYSECDVLEPITSSSGGSTFIADGGSTLRLGTTFLSRNLFNIRDIDKTLDLFIVHFKEKYLKNIEFDISTNKELLVKNSLDLYRSKGTERSIDLFFRLIYGVSAKVYYPGEDLFKLSAAQWVRPQYIEITSSSEQRAVSFVGKQVTGVTSGATAFVERYIKRKIKNGWVHVLYVTNIKGDFTNRELLRSDRLYPDCPKVLGSLNAVDIVSGSKLFSVGDLVTFNSARGDHGIARVSSITNRTGVVDFLLIDGGWGYTESANSSYSEDELAERTQSIVSEKVLGFGDVQTSNTIDYIVVTTGGTGYSNSDKITVVSSYGINATAALTTNNTGGIANVEVIQSGSGFFYDPNPAATIANSSGGASAGSGATLTTWTKIQDSFFDLFETYTQIKADITYDHATNNELIITGGDVVIGNNVGFIVSTSPGGNSSVGVMEVVMNSKNPFSNGATITFTGGTANAGGITNTSATGTVMGLPNTATFFVTSVVGTMERGQEVYQTIAGADIATATISATSIPNTTGSIDVVNLRGVFSEDLPLYVRSSAVTATISSIRLSTGLYQITGNFSNAVSLDGTIASGISSKTGTVAPILTISSGEGAGFRVGAISNPEFIYLNTDALGGNNVSNVPYMSVALSASAYGFPKNPLGNSASIMYSCLNFDSFTLGSIASLTSINPGSDYNVDPFVLAYQPYIAGFNYRDYVITITDGSGDFAPDEIIEQSSQTVTQYALQVSSTTDYQVGERVYQGTVGSETATGLVVSITSGTNTIHVQEVTGTFTNTTLKSYITPALSATVSSSTLEQVITTARAQVKSANSSAILAKRIQFENQFIVGQTVTGASTGAAGIIVSVEQDANTLPIGLNAAISGNVVTANGAITSLQIIDSGVGYANGEIMLYTSEDGLRSGEAKAVVSNYGTGSGYYKTSKGFLSSLSKLHDGDYYQEYSYEILSRIPLDKYGEMFSKVMHTAGTRFFGSILVETDADSLISYADSSVTLS